MLVGRECGLVVKLGIVTEQGAHGSRDSAFCWV